MIEKDFKYPLSLFNELSSASSAFAAESTKEDPEVWKKVIEKAAVGESLTLDDVNEWAEKILPTQTISLNVDQAFIDFVNDSLKKELTKISDKIKLLAEVYQKFVALNSEQDNSQLVGHLMMNYVSRRLEFPVILFREDEKSTLDQACHNLFQAQIYFAEKVRDFYIHGKTLMRREEKSGDTYTYQAEDKKPSQLVEWHDFGRYVRGLIKAQK